MSRSVEEAREEPPEAAAALVPVVGIVIVEAIRRGSARPGAFLLVPAAASANEQIGLVGVNVGRRKRAAGLKESRGAGERQLAKVGVLRLWLPLSLNRPP